MFTLIMSDCFRYCGKTDTKSIIRLYLKSIPFINPKTIIGNNVTVSQLTTIGENRGKAPIINDNTYISAGCNICGPINIKTNVTIGMGSVVVKNIESNKIVAGNPAKIIGENTIPPVE